MSRRRPNTDAEVRMRAVCRLSWFAILIAAAAAVPRPAAAHDFYIIPAESFPRTLNPMEVANYAGDIFPGDPESWRVDRMRDLFLYDANGRMSLKDTEFRGAPMKAVVPPRIAGSVVVALVTEPAYIEVPPQNFNEYLEQEGHDHILKARRQARREATPGKERYTRYAKTVFHALATPTDAVLANLGLPIEILPGAQPALLKPGDTLPVKVVLGGKPFARGYLCATFAGFKSEEEDYAWCERLDDGGAADVPINAVGWYLLRITHMQARKNDPKADWESYQASLTFEVPKKLPKPPAQVKASDKKGGTR